MQMLPIPRWHALKEGIEKEKQINAVKQKTSKRPTLWAPNNPGVWFQRAAHGS
jgi:hypothetical protein